MIIEPKDAADARELARRLLQAAGGDRSQVRTVWRGARMAFRVPDELGAAVGRAPDSTGEQLPSSTPPPVSVPEGVAPAGGEDAGTPDKDGEGDPVTEADPVAADPVGADTPDDPAPAEDSGPAEQPAPKKRGRPKRIE